MRTSCAIAAAAVWLCAAVPADAADAADFQRDIAPILQNHCVKCHGETKHKGGLRLHAKQAAMTGGDSGPVIVPGDSAASELFKRIATDDEIDRMPPDDEGEPLTADQIALIKKWIDAGANWPDALAGAAGRITSDHWSFQPPKQVAPPAVKWPNWPRNPIDHFIAAKLTEAGLAPAPEADRQTLVRRLYLDLIGLPPTPRQADAFLHDTRPDAYERLVDELLASPHYGERWARRWLDLARYADTHGYEKDRVRSMWPYRNWVIKALNDDMPFDRFTIEQIAGDMLPGSGDAGLSQRIATGFHRNTMINEEGGIDVEEFRYYAVVDRVATTGTVWLGLTLACAQCHTHKYDPITQREYYSFFALLNNADEPQMDVVNDDVTRQRIAVARRIAELEAALPEQFPLPQPPVSTRGADGESTIDEAALRREHLLGKFADWQSQTAAKSRRWLVVPPVNAVSEGRATMTVQPDGSVLVSGDWPNFDTYTVELHVPMGRVAAIRLEALPDVSLPEGGPGRAPLFSDGDFLLSEFEVAAAPIAGDAAPTPIALQSAAHSYAQSGRDASHVLDGNLDTGWSIKPRTGEPHHIVVQLKNPLDASAGVKLVVTLKQRYIHQMTLGRFRLSVTGDAEPAASSGVPADVEAALITPDDARTDAQRDALLRYYLSVAPELAEARKPIDALRQSMPRYPTTLVMQERTPAHARTTHIHHRGEFLKTREPVQPGSLDVLHPLPASDQAPDRLTLARWLVSPDNPLVGRVVMNRHWHAFFGQGIVTTTEDFGTQGAKPSHPELLDWLAVEFVKRGWSVKQMHRLIVTSATYRQSSDVSPDKLHKDPRNTLLARMPRLRLEAEMLRDSALTVSGLLSDKIGGPSVFPPQPPGVTSLSYGALDWKTSTGEDRYRRGLYTFTKRTTPYAMFTTFDAGSGETCLVRRERSNTPLQALTLLNDAVFIEAAQALAKSVLADATLTDDDARLAELFRRCVTRTPTDAERAALIGFYRAQLDRFVKGELNAAQVAGVDAKSPPTDANVNALAAWTTVARVMLNLDEGITRP